MFVKKVNVAFTIVEEKPTKRGDIKSPLKPRPKPSTDNSIHNFNQLIDFVPLVNDAHKNFEKVEQKPSKKVDSSAHDMRGYVNNKLHRAQSMPNSQRLNRPKSAANNLKATEILPHNKQEWTCFGACDRDVLTIELDSSINQYRQRMSKDKEPIPPSIFPEQGNGARSDIQGRRIRTAPKTNGPILNLEAIRPVATNAAGIHEKRWNPQTNSNPHDERLIPTQGQNRTQEAFRSAFYGDKIANNFVEKERSLTSIS